MVSLLHRATIISIGDLQWSDPNGNVISAERDSDTALQDFFSSVYTVEPQGEFDALPDISYSIPTDMCDII